MEKFIIDTRNLPRDINVFGFSVANFPAGIGEAFEVLIKKTGDFAGARNYYGLSQYRDGQMVYYVLAEEKFTGEAEKYAYEKLIIERGDYLSIPVFEWRNKTACIKDVFSEIMQDSRANKTEPAIEWYKNDNEMLCLVKMNKSKK